MARPTKDARGLAKAERDRDRHAKRAAKLAKRREAREPRAEPERVGEAPQQTGLRR